jgi:hypothetical protein
MASFRSLKVPVNTGIKHAEKEYDGSFGAGTPNDFLYISPADVNNGNFALNLAEEKEV